MRNNLSQNEYSMNGIYAIHNIASNKYYIGQTFETFYKRFLRHNNMLENNTHFNKHLQNAYNKYGAGNFEFLIIEVCDEQDKLNSLEQFYIEQYQAQYGCYNILAGGENMRGNNNPFFGRKHTVASKEKMSKAQTGKHIGKLNNFYGENHSGEHNGFYGHKHTDESRKKMSDTKSRMYIGEGNPFYGKTHTTESIELIRRKNIEAVHRRVICIETGVTYRSIAEAGRQTNTSAKQISYVCAGHGKTAGKLHWKYVDDNEEVGDAS